MRHDRIESQPELLLDKPRDATPEEVQEWHDSNLQWWADRQFTAILIASIVQLSALGFMFSVMIVVGEYT
tara:strand:- start:134 stop:343 length:210 start_codon:yes stop_codon:yes gene_type:complete